MPRFPLALAMCTVPFSRSSTVRTTSMPTPRPETSVTSVGGAEARLEDKVEGILLGETLGFFGLE